jgi:hypothetical protein
VVRLISGFRDVFFIFPSLFSFFMAPKPHEHVFEIETTKGVDQILGKDVHVQMIVPAKKCKFCPKKEHDQAAVDKILRDACRKFLETSVEPEPVKVDEEKFVAENETRQKIYNYVKSKMDSMPAGAVYNDMLDELDLTSDEADVELAIMSDQGIVYEPTIGRLKIVS